MFVNRIRKMISFEFDKEIEKDVIHKFRKRPRSLLNLCGSVVEHRSAESKGLRFDSSRGLRKCFCLSNARDKTKNIFLHFFTDSKPTIFLILFNLSSTIVPLLRKQPYLQ